MLITRTSLMTGITRTLDLDVTEHQLALWASGIVAQVAFHNLPPAAREFLMTGITQAEWDRLAPADEEEDI